MFHNNQYPLIYVDAESEMFNGRQLIGDLAYELKRGMGYSREPGELFASFQNQFIPWTDEDCEGVRWPIPNQISSGFALGLMQEHFYSWFLSELKFAAVQHGLKELNARQMLDWISSVAPYLETYYQVVHRDIEVLKARAQAERRSIGGYVPHKALADAQYIEFKHKLLTRGADGEYLDVADPDA